MQDVLQRFSTGPGTDWRTAATSFLQRWAPSAVSGWEKQSSNLSGNDAAQAFSKLALVGAGTQERGVLGARGDLSKVSNCSREVSPNVDLNDYTNWSILDMQMISNQAGQDYTQKAFLTSRTMKRNSRRRINTTFAGAVRTTGAAQRNPQVYSAAMRPYASPDGSARSPNGPMGCLALNTNARSASSRARTRAHRRERQERSEDLDAARPVRRQRQRSPATQATRLQRQPPLPPPAQRTVGNKLPDTPQRKSEVDRLAPGWVAP